MTEYTNFHKRELDYKFPSMMPTRSIGVEKACGVKEAETKAIN